jgi:hypothetical protein
MSDSSTAAETPAPASEPAPAAAAPAPEPVAAPATEVTPAATPEPVAEPAAPSPEPEPAAAAGEPAPATVQDPAAAELEKAPEAAEPVAEPPKPEPPTYTDFKFPDGVKVAPEAMTAATKVFGEFGLTQEQAQRLIDIHAEQQQAAVKQFTTAATDYWNAESRKWVAEVEKTFGNQLNTNIERARAVWSDVLPKQADRDRLFGALNDTKIGDHPMLARALAEVGRRFEQIYQLTGTNSWDAAMRRLREPAAPPPAQPARAPGAAGRPADRRYSGTRA